MSAFWESLGSFADHTGPYKLFHDDKRKKIIIITSAWYTNDKHREEFGNSIGRIKDQLIQQMQEGFKQNRDKNALLNRINDIKDQQSQLEFDHKMFNQQMQQKRELNKKTESIEKRQMEWEEEQAKLREKRLEQRKKMMQERHEMRLDEHAQLMNGLKGFLTAFQNLWQDNLDKEKRLKPALPIYHPPIHQPHIHQKGGMNVFNRNPAVGYETRMTNVDYNRPPPLLPPIPPLPPQDQLDQEQQ